VGIKEDRSVKYDCAKVLRQLEREICRLESKKHRKKLKESLFFFSFYFSRVKRMKSIRCRIGWHKRRIMLEPPAKGLNCGTFTECERCGLAEKWTISLAIPGGLTYSVPLSEQIATAEVIKVEKALKCTFEDFNKNGGTQTKKDFVEWQEKLSDDVRAWFLKYAKREKDARRER